MRTVSEKCANNLKCYIDDTDFFSTNHYSDDLFQCVRDRSIVHHKQSEKYLAIKVEPRLNDIVSNNIHVFYTIYSN